VRRLDIDQPAIVKVEVFEDETDELVDPDEPLFRIKTPAGDLPEPEVQHVSKGVFKCRFEHDEPGKHIVLYVGKGSHRIGGEIAYMVSTPKVPRD
jgi:hypothetical protein